MAKNLREEVYERKRELWRARQGAPPAPQPAAPQPPAPRQPVFPLRAPQPALDRAPPVRPLPSRDAPLTDVNPVTGAPLSLIHI